MPLPGRPLRGADEERSLGLFYSQLQSLGLPSSSLLRSSTFPFIFQRNELLQKVLTHVLGAAGAGRAPGVSFEGQVWLARSRGCPPGHRALCCVPRGALQADGVLGCPSQGSAGEEAK